MDKLISINNIGPDNYYDFSWDGSAYKFPTLNYQNEHAFEEDKDGNITYLYTNYLSKDHKHPYDLDYWESGILLDGPEHNVTVYDKDEGAERSYSVIYSLRNKVWSLSKDGHDHDGEYVYYVGGANGDVTLSLFGLSSNYVLNNEIHEFTISAPSQDTTGLSVTGIRDINSTIANNMTHISIATTETVFNGSSSASAELLFVEDSFNI